MRPVLAPTRARHAASLVGHRVVPAAAAVAVLSLAGCNSLAAPPPGTTPRPVQISVPRVDGSAPTPGPGNPTPVPAAGSAGAPGPVAPTTMGPQATPYVYP